MIPDAVEVSGSDSDDAKIEKFGAFIDGDIRVLVTKPKIGALGLNFQHCSHITFFPSHSYEQYYQAVRRCYRFGQKNEVTVDLVYTEGQNRVMKNLQRKAKQADKMFEQLVSEMNNSIAINRINQHTKKVQVPSWL
jgi:SNF2 family DNA or RNA helicase